MRVSRPSVAALVSLILCALGGPACGGASGGSGGGTSSSSSSASTTSSSTTGGACASCSPPPCFVAAFTPCDVSGACTQQTNAGSVDICYANGVKERTIVAATSTLTVYKADGMVCLASSSVFTSTSVTATWKDGSGKLLFTDEAPIAGGAQTVVCDGQTFTYDPTSAACKGCNPGTSVTCTMGACAIP